MKLNKIKIENVERWDVAKYDEFLYDAEKELNARCIKKGGYECCELDP